MQKYKESPLESKLSAGILYISIEGVARDRAAERGGWLLAESFHKILS